MDYPRLAACAVFGVLTGCGADLDVLRPAPAADPSGAFQLVEAGNGRNAVLIGGRSVFVSTPDPFEVVGVSACELVSLVFVAQLDMAASCSGSSAAVFGVTSFYPDAQRAFALTVETLQRGGASVEFEQGAVIVTASQDDRGAEGRTTRRNEGPETAEELPGVGSVVVGDLGAFSAAPRVLLDPGGGYAQRVIGSVEEVRELVAVLGLDVRVGGVDGRVWLVGDEVEVELVRSSIASDLFVLVLPPVTDFDAFAEIAFERNVASTLVANGVILTGFPEDVRAVREVALRLGMFRLSRAIDLAFVLATDTELSEAGLTASASITTGSAVLDVSGGAVGLRAALDVLSSRTRVQIDQRPSLSIVDGKPASLSVGQEVPVRTRSDEDGDTFEYRQTGTILNVLTEPLPGGRALASIRVEVSTVEGEGVGGNPIVSSQVFNAELVLVPGVPIVFASLNSQQSSDTSARSLGFLPSRSRDGQARSLHILAELR